MKALQRAGRLGYTCAVPSGMGLKSPRSSGCRTRQSMRHFYARAIFGRGCDGYNTRKGKKSAQLDLGFEPPAASMAALKTLRRGFVSLIEERFMSQSVQGTTALSFTFSTQQLRAVMIDGEPWFVAADVCDALNHSDTSMACSRLDDDEKLVQAMFVSGQNREILLINESGLYSLILTSRKPEAKKFKKWVTSEVLPAIRKTGRYVAPVAPAHPQGERLSANDWRNLKRAVWIAVHGFRFEGVWTQAVWFYLRRALGVPTPGDYSIDHLPRLGQELQAVISATEQVHTMLIAIEQEAAKRIFRKGECADMVVSELQAQAMARLDTMQGQLVTLPTYLARDMAAIPSRAPNGYDHGNNEQPEFFGKGVAA